MGITHRLRSLLGAVLVVSTPAWGAAPDFEQPKFLTGSIIARGSTNVLFHFKRTAARTGPAVQVLRDFTDVQGRLAARERCTFADGRLTGFQLELLQIIARGSTTVAPDPRNPGRQKLTFEYFVGAKKKTNTETTQGEVLIGDMIPYFIVTHWDEMMRGKPAPFRFIAQERLETVGFKLVRDSELTWKGKAAVRLRMEPTSFIIAAIVDPLFFIVEKEGAHRVLQYDGRTTPRIVQGGAWKDLDAVTVYDWPD